jgi:hypothetical protein
MNGKDISIVVVDAVAYDIDENPDAALKNIQDLVKSGLTDKMYEFRAGESYLSSVGNVKTLDRRYSLDEVTDNIVLVGGSLGNKHASALWQIIKQAEKEGKTPKIHVPLDCTYSFTQEYDSGESWTDGCLGYQEMEILAGYKKNPQVKIWESSKEMSEQLKK